MSTLAFAAGMALTSVAPWCLQQLCGCLSMPKRIPGQSDRILGAFVFPQVWNDLAEFRTLLTKFRDQGVNSIFAESETYDPAAINAAHDLGLRFYAGIACFSDHATNFRRLANRPELWPILETGQRRSQMEWYIGISPTDRSHQKEILASIRAIAAYQIDGLFLDFVRWPVHWEIELRPGRPRAPDSSFDPTTVAKFQEATGVSMPPELDSVPAQAAWIRAHHLVEWVDFKCKVVTDFVREARTTFKQAKPDADLGIYIVPNVDGMTELLTGQRLVDLAPLVEWVSPMLYHNILLRPPSWIGEALTEVLSIAGRKTLPVLQADSNRDPGVTADWGPAMSPADWQAALAQVAGRSDTAGITVFPGTSLTSNRRGAVLWDMLAGRK